MELRLIQTANEIRSSWYSTNVKQLRRASMVIYCEFTVNIRI